MNGSRVILLLLATIGLSVNALQATDTSTRFESELQQLIRRSRVQTVMVIVQADHSLRDTTRDELIRERSAVVSTIIAKFGISQELVDHPLPEPVPDGSEERPRPPASRNPCRPVDVAQLRTLLREHSRDAVILVTLGRRAGRDGAPEIVARIRVIDPFSQWFSTVIPIGQPVEPAKHSPEFVADVLVTEP